MGIALPMPTINKITDQPANEVLELTAEREKLNQPKTNKPFLTLTDQELSISEMKLECLKVAAKYSYNEDTLIALSKKLFSLLNLNQ
jgi:hypothetical protein